MRYWRRVKVIEELQMGREMNVSEVHAICTVNPVGSS